MDVIEFWKKQVDLWNEENFCDRKWTFGAPLSESGVNMQQHEQDEACHTHVIVSNLTETVIPSYSMVTGLLNGRPTTYNMTVHFLQRDELGKNTYNEILGHPVEESRWFEILKPLRECLSVENLLAFCQILGYPVQITAWSLENRIRWLDNIYTGVSINMSLRLTN